MMTCNKRQKQKLECYYKFTRSPGQGGGDQVAGKMMANDIMQQVAGTGAGLIAYI